MSANAYSDCPRCKYRAGQEVAKRTANLNAGYGKLLIDEFHRERAAIAEIRAPEDTFREEWEFYGIGDGVVTVRYSGNCTSCHLSVDFENTHPFWKPEDEK